MLLFLIAAGCLVPLNLWGQGLIDGGRKVIIVGFVGGFVRHDDTKHAEVKFAAHLRERYRSAIDVEVFGNHSGGVALEHVLRVIGPDRAHARIIIFGHSWGGTETVTLARELAQKNIPVLLTIQVDSIGKPGEENSTIPANVENAVNFYQSHGLLHGRSEILAQDPSRTNIIGNFEMTYKDHPIDCKDFPWFARVFTKPHIEIENDPRVWTEAASLIDFELSDAKSTARASLSATHSTMRK
jgi:pimeloyl-ACP methyl ester carboxylesterase